MLQILNATHRTSGGWINHPTTRMWRGHEPVLVMYGVAIIDVRTRKGRGDSVREKILPHLHGEPMRTQRELGGLGLLPPWLGRNDLHRAYRSAPVREMPEHYGPFFPRRRGGSALRVAGVKEVMRADPRHRWRVYGVVV